MTKKWQIAPKITKEFQSKFPEIDPLVLQLLHNRGLRTQEQIDEFLNPDYSQDLHNPFLFKDMEKTVKRIFQARDKKEKVIVHGDYDADGICATAVMSTILKEIGFEPRNLDIYIPHRVTEGYGINPETIKLLKKRKTNLIITVDCGISNKNEIAAANQAGINVIVTDHHHEPLERPDAFAIINPSLKDSGYLYQHLSGCGVAFKVAQALVQKSKEQGVKVKNWEAVEKWLLDLVAIGTVADMMPLLGENRTLVKYGLIVLGKTQRPGLQQLMKVSDSELENVGTPEIGFQIAPRLNAAGRLDHGNVAYQLLITDSEKEAGKLAQQLDRTNSQRQKVTGKITEAAKKQLGEVTDKQYLLFACGKNWPMGIVGLVAGKIMDEYHRPTVIIGDNKEGLVGSGRSIDQFNIIEAVQGSADLLTKFGGHAAACGFQLKSKSVMKEFEKRLENLAAKQLKPEDLEPKIQIDQKLDINQTNWELFTALEQFPPYGEEAGKPRFVSYQAELIGLKTVGSEADHLKLIVKGRSTKRQVIGFGHGQLINQLKLGEKIDIVYNLEVNEWNGRRELQLKLIDLKKSQH